MSSDYNSFNRHIIAKIEIYFDGDSMSPLTITRNDYLIDCTHLEELGADDGSPLGTMSANSIDFLDESISEPQFITPQIPPSLKEESTSLKSFSNLSSS